ncbi:hypothetical protein L7F22_007598 [Adiantum nelumboides]|nr:hypothetical protein [Adiantum nelumboides]
MQAINAGDSLLPGLPDAVVLSHVVSRLPWCIRPVCRSISKHWRGSIDAFMKEPYHAVESRRHQLPLLSGHFIICTSADAQLFLFRDHVKKMQTYHTVLQGKIRSLYWQKLPPLPYFVRGPCRSHEIFLLANYGMVFVWANKGLNVVWKLDLGRGDWIWTMQHVPCPFNLSGVIFKGNIYAPLDDSLLPLDDAAGLQTERQRWKGILVYDMMLDLCKGMVKGNFPDLRVLQPRSGSALYAEEELYSLTELASELVVAVFDALRKSWRITAEIPIPEWKWSYLTLVHLLNDHCFEPATETGVNIVWWDEQLYMFFWFNSSLHKSWVRLQCEYGALVFEYPVFVGGSLYGVFLEVYDEKDEFVYGREEDAIVQGDTTLCKCTSMNQGICKDGGGLYGKERENRGSEVEEDCKGQHVDLLSKEEKQGGGAGNVCTSQEDLLFCGRAIAKGTICVAESILKWEKVHDIGIFQDVLMPVNDCAVIA